MLRERAILSNCFGIGSRSSCLLGRLSSRLSRQSTFLVCFCFLGFTTGAYSQETYQYDTLGRLTKVTYPDGSTVDYTYDPAGNRVSKVTAGVAGPNFVVDDQALLEGAPLLFTVTRNGDTVQAVTVDFATADDTALAGSDYTSTSGTLSFGSGESIKTVSVAVAPETTIESDETFFLDLSNPTGGATIADAQGIGTILDDDFVNTAPNASADVAAMDEDLSHTFDPRVNDNDADGHTLTVTSVTSPTNGSASYTATSVTYTPTTGWSGSDSFDYTIDDGNGGTSTATVSVTVQAVAPPATARNVAGAIQSPYTEGSAELAGKVYYYTYDSSNMTVHLSVDGGHCDTGGFKEDYYSFTGNGCEYVYAPPSGSGGANTVPNAYDDSISLVENTNYTFTPLGNDVDGDGDTLTISSKTNGANGTASIVGGTSLTYTSTGGQGADSFTYSISDGNGGTDTATVNVTILPPNAAPTAVDDTSGVDEDSSSTFDPMVNDSDVESDPFSITGVTQGSSGTVAYTATDVTYTPNADFSGTDTFTYTIDDTVGGPATATVTMTVNPLNDAPIAFDDSETATQDTAHSFDPRGNDTDVDGDVLSVTGVTQGTSGAVAFTANDVTYTANTGFTGSDSFTYTIGDGNGGTDTATVSMTVNFVNTPPVATDDTMNLPEDTPTTQDPRVNDNDANGHALTITGVSQGTNGSVTFTGTNLSYTPDINWNGSDSFTYTIDDGNGGADSGTVSVNVSAVNDNPTALNDTQSTDQNSAKTFNPRNNDTDVDGDPLTVTAVTQGSNGSATFTASNVTYTPNAGFTGSDSFTYTISDGNGGSDTATVNMTVNASAPNTPPVANNDSIVVFDGGQRTFNPRANDSDADGDPLTITGKTNGSLGTVQIKNGGTRLKYTHTGVPGTDTFTYTISDGNGGTDTATVTVTILPGL